MFSEWIGSLQNETMELHFQIIDQGTDISKEAAVLIGIRRSKMKKHQKKKWRKRMQFKIRDQKIVKLKKREKKLQEFEKEYSNLTGEFDAEKFVDEQLALARKGGWGIDIWSQRKERQQGKQ